MIFAAAAFGITPVDVQSAKLGTHEGTPVWAHIDSNGAVRLQFKSHETVPPPAKGCIPSIALRDAVEVLWVCGATGESFGAVHEVVLELDDWSVRASRATPDGLKWLQTRVDEAIAANDSSAAHALVSRFAGRLHYTADADTREALLTALVAGLVQQCETDPTSAGHEVEAFLMSPPVWEPERPWDYMKRLRVGPARGNRPAPEREAYLSDTPDNRAHMLALAHVLLRSGQPAHAHQIAQNLAALAPDDPDVDALLTASAALTPAP